MIYTTSSCDDFHMEMLKVFLFSLRKNGRVDCPVVVDLYDGSGDYGLKKINPNVEINHMKSSVVEIEEKDRYLIPLYNLNIMWTRPFGVLRMLEAGHKRLLTVDTDIIVRDDIRPIFEGLSPGMIKWFYRPHKKSVGVRVQGGVIAFGNSDLIVEYYRRVLAACRDNRDPYIMQTSLYNLQIEMGIPMVNFGRKYNDDGEFRKSSKIWHCKHTHYEDKPWRKEFKGYLKQI